MVGKLAPKQELFVQEYLVDLNATQAAIRAGYSQKTAEVLGYQLLQKPLVAAAITEAKAKRAERLEITADRVLQELAKIAFTDHVQVVEQDPETGQAKLKPLSEIPSGIISEISERNGKLVVKLWDKGQALNMLGKHLGLFDDKTPPPPPATVNVHLNLQDLVREEVRRAVATTPKTLEEVNAANPVPPPPDGFKVREDP